MKAMAVALTTLVFCILGCASGPFVTKTQTGNLAIDIVAPDGVDTRMARIVVDGISVGNSSKHYPILHLRTGPHVVRVELEGFRTREQSIEILGAPNHQVLNFVLEKN